MKTSNLFSYLAFLNLNHQPRATTTRPELPASTTPYFPAILRRIQQQY